MSSNPTDRSMSDTAQILSPDCVVGSRVAFWLRSHGYTAKRTARIIDASEATGKRLRAGAAPTTEQMTALSRHFGWNFLRHVYEAVIGPSDDQLDKDLHEIKARISRLETTHAPVHQAAPPVLPMDGQDLGGVG